MHSDALEDQRRLYDRIGFSSKLGMGSRPALLVIDMCRGITERGYPLSISMDQEIKSITQLLVGFREIHAPIIYTSVGYAPDGSDGAYFIKKVPHLSQMVTGDPMTFIDPRIGPRESELVIEKQFPSAFAGTAVQAILSSQSVDTLIVVGNSTSGCVRATVVDGISLGFRVVVARDAVADRAPLSHDVSLFDMASKYCDVEETQHILMCLTRTHSDKLPATESPDTRP